MTKIDYQNKKLNFFNISSFVKKNKLKHNSALIQAFEQNALVENNKNGILFGFTDNYIKVKINAESSIENTIQMVNILDFKGEYVLGEIKAVG